MGAKVSHYLSDQRKSKDVLYSSLAKDTRTKIIIKKKNRQRDSLVF